MLKRLKGKKAKILVIGDLMLDHYLWGKCERISPEAPVQIVDIERETTILGGAGNVVNNLISFGAEVGVISVVGEDNIAEELKEMLLKKGVEINLISEKGRKTTKKSRVIASNQQVIRVDKESREDISKISQEKLFSILEEKIDNYQTILLSDYNKGVLTKELTEKIISFVNYKNKKILIDPKGEDYSKYRGAYLLTPNRKEASIASKIEIKDRKSLKKAIKKLKKELNLRVSIITLSEEGIALFDKKLQIFPTLAKEVFDVTGAGDTVLASLAFALTLENSIEEAIKFANLSAGVVVGKIGSATATIEEIEEYQSRLNKSSGNSHIKSFEEIEKIVKDLKSRGKKIIFTNGCFDILHIGHIKYLEEAKSYGDVLILGLNSDNSVRRLKGENRPINREYERAYILGALEVVDFVVIFGEDTPYNLIKIIKPDILVKGGDYKDKKIVGSDIAKEVRLVDFVEGKSTTNIIKKIQQ